tara:strand:- start:240 stop:494 length:255 start_codon:yes stop_codon:yes gene_type:complete
MINNIAMWLRKNLILIDVYYYMPDPPHLIQEFIWQTDDITPELPRVHKFLNYWKENIDAVIQEVKVSYTDGSGEIRFADDFIQH